MTGALTAPSLSITADNAKVNNKNIVRSVNGTTAGEDGNMVLTTAVPTGTILPYCGTSAPTGFLICNGGEISRTTYSTLFQLIGTKYGAGNGSTTFNLPNMHHRFLEGTTTASEVNTYVEAGLPNINGRFLGCDLNKDSDGVWSGAFVASDCSGGVSMGSVSIERTTTFSANLSNGLFGLSSTVQPNAIRFLFVIKY